MSADPYQSLNEKLKRIHLLESISGLLEWDEQVNLPPDSHGLRQDQSAALASLTHQIEVDPEIGTLLATLESLPLDDDQKAVTREARRDFDRVSHIPQDWVERHARLSSEAFHAWAAARKANDFAAFAPYLQKHIDMAKERAGYLGWEDRPYDLMIDFHDPGIDAATIEKLFSELKAELVPLADRILRSPVSPPADLFTNFPADQQKSFLEEVTRSLGFDYRRGRIDVSLHPFCSGNGADIRMTTRFDENNPLDSLFSSIHEAGHGLYEQGLPLDSLHNALGKAAGMGVHESQSRLWENQVSRSRGFWKHYEPKFRQAFPKQLQNVSSDELYLAINAVGRNPIRVDADEVTYNLHIIIRFEVEQKLFSGELSVAELPAYWNAQYSKLIGVMPRNDAEGVLQDVHWSSGAFGYFPSYCLGNMLAAQLWQATQSQLPNLEESFARGDFSDLLAWLRVNVHQQGARYNLLELTRRVTGKDLSSKALIAYLGDRYLPLYTA